MYVIILAAGKGTRMKSQLPKCACPLNNKPMINYLLETLKKMNMNNIYIVVGYQKEYMIDIIKEEVFFVEQPEQLGTGHAVLCCTNKMRNLVGDTLILSGDMPLVGKEILSKLIAHHQQQKNDLTILTTKVSNPQGYGRVIRSEDYKVIRIVEEKDTTKTEREVKEINTGIYCINNQILFQNINKITNNNIQKEFYLTDLVEILLKKYQVGVLNVDNSYHLIGINDMETLKKVEKSMEEEKCGID